MPRRLLTIAVGSLLLAGPAIADVNVFIDYDKDKTITVDETISIYKTVYIEVEVDIEVERAAEAEALINQTNYSNRACENCAEKRDIIENSVNENSGVIDVNQAAGNMNNQGNAVSISVDDRFIPPDAPGESPKEGGSYAQAQAAADQRNGSRLGPWVPTEPPGEEGNGFESGNLVDATNLLEKSASIFGSINANEGVVNVNQSAGNMANQANNLAMAVGFGEFGVAIAESDLGQYNIWNTVLESGEEHDSVDAETPDGIVFKAARIDASINDNSGVVGVNQTAGNMANQANVVSFAVVIGGDAVSTTGGAN